MPNEWAKTIVSKWKIAISLIHFHFTHSHAGHLGLENVNNGMVDFQYYYLSTSRQVAYVASVSIYCVCVCVSIRIIDKLCNEIAADAHTHSHRNIFEIVAVFYHKHRLSYTQTQIRLPSSIPRRTYVIRTLYRPVCIV